MNNKIDLPAVSQPQATLTPNLRFPEFKETDKWVKKSLSQICNITNGKSNAQDHIENGVYPLFDRSAEIKKSNNYLFDCEAVILPGEGMHFIPKYYQGKFDLHQRAYALSKFKCNGKFVYYQMDYLRKVLASKAVLSTVLSLRLPIISNFLIGMPNCNQEQQKIADCLSSIDALITAQAKKVEALKQHKKGLMQQLFPAEGETVPKLRFPEFREAGEWEEKSLKEITSAIFDGTHQTPSYTPEGVPFFSVENIVSGNKNKFISYSDYLTATNKNKPELEDILITRIGKIGFTKVITWDYEFSIYVTLAVIKKSDLFNSYFLHYFMQTARYQSEILRHSLLNAVPCKINMESLRRTKTTLPKMREQQIISDCFLRIDQIIESNIQKLDILKQHKQGLMQQLFPTVKA